MTITPLLPIVPAGESAHVSLPADPFSLDDKDQAALLQELIAKEINPSTQPTDAEIQRIRLMLQLLFHSSIVKPLRPNHEQAKLALAVIVKKATALPVLLQRLPPSSELQMPLYKWIIPRALETLARYMECDSPPDLSDALINMITHVVTLLRKEDAALGDLQATMCAKDIHFWTQSERLSESKVADD